MSISSAQAADALRDVDAAEVRVHDAIAYHYAAPYLILWGAIWVAGYLASGLLGAERSLWLWLPLVVLGGAATVWLGARDARSSAAAAATRLALWVAPFAAAMIALFFFASMTIFRPTSEAAMLVFPALVTGLVYVVMGLARLYRLMLVGAAMMALAFVGYLMLTPYLAFWIAGVGGGGLILGGLWLRAA